MFCNLLVFILQASCEQIVKTTSLCDKEVVAQAKILEQEVESPQMLSNWLSLMKFSVQYLGIWLTELPTHSWLSSGKNHERRDQLTAQLAIQNKSWQTLCYDITLLHLPKTSKTISWDGYIGKRRNRIKMKSVCDGKKTGGRGVS